MIVSLEKTVEFFFAFVYIIIFILFAVHLSFITIVFVNLAKKKPEEQRAGRAIRILSLLSWFRLHGRRDRKLLSSDQHGSIFSPVSAVLCGCPILLTHQPCSN